MYICISIMVFVMNVKVFFVIISCLAVVACGQNAPRKTSQNTESTTPAQTFPDPVQYTYKIVATYPHDTEAYTQGLFWRDGFMYEGTGRNGASELRRVELATGRPQQSISLERKYFGEGITWHDGKIYQLTWVAGKSFVYDAESFRKLKSFVYDGEGWGITSDGQYLYMSDGSDVISVRDPENFGVLRRIEVRSGSRVVDSLNELEWIDGRIWANRYLYNEVVIINPESGRVEGVIDFSGLQQPEDITDNTDVLNGIAYDADNGYIYVTGKNWNKIYRIEIVEAKQ